MEHLNLSKSFQKREWEKGEINGGDEPTWGVIYVYMEFLQQNLHYNYHISLKLFKM
jgi:hypothetical protein